MPADLNTIKGHAGGSFAYLGERYIRRLIEERKIPSYRVGGVVLASAADIEALIACGLRPAFA
jgi:excisionase family DNA binding protein